MRPSSPTAWPLPVFSTNDLLSFSVISPNGFRFMAMLLISSLIELMEVRFQPLGPARLLDGELCLDDEAGDDAVLPVSYLTSPAIPSIIQGLDCLFQPAIEAHLAPLL